MKRDDLKKTLDAIQPDAYMKTRMAAKLETEKTAAKPKRQWVRVLLAVVLCAALTAGIVGYDLYGNRAAVTEETETSRETFFSDGRVPGGLFYAYAKDGEIDTVVVNADTMTFPVRCRICFKRIEGLSEEEKEAARQEIIDQIEIYDPGTFDAAAPTAERGYFGGIGDDRVASSSYMLDAFYLDLTDEETADLESIHIYNENDLMEFEYESATECLGDALKFDGADPPVPRVSTGRDINMDGNTFRNDKRYCETMPVYSDLLRQDTAFFYERADGFLDYVAENPDFVISDLTDTLHFEVYFRDGSFTETVVQVTFDADGFMNLTPLVCRYVTAGEQTEEATTEGTTEETITAEPSVTEEATENSTDSNQILPESEEKEAENPSEDKTEQASAD